MKKSVRKRDNNMKKVIALFLALCMSICVFSACKNKELSDNSISSEISDDLKQIELTAENITFSIPSSWANIENLNADVFSEIYGNKDYTRFLGIISEPKNVFDSSTDINKYKELIKNQMAQNASAESIEASEESLTINGLNAVKLQFTLPVEDIDFYYYLVIFEKDNNYNQMLFWTSKQFEENSKVLFENIASTLK